MIMGRPFEDRERFMGNDGYWYYRCYKCEEWLPHYKMCKNASEKFGIDSKCKVCKAVATERYRRNRLETVREKKHGSRYIQSIGKVYSNVHECYSDYEDTMNFLQKIGYDTKGDIHKQFVQKMKMVYDVKLQYNPIHYSEHEPYNYTKPNGDPIREKNILKGILPLKKKNN